MDYPGLQPVLDFRSTDLVADFKQVAGLNESSEMRLTRKKLREAEYFLQQLEQHAGTTRRTEVADYYFSAFVTSGRSVTLVLQKEHKSEYDAFWEPWRARLPKADQRLCEVMKDYRNAEQKEGCQEREAVWDFRPVTECTERELGGKVTWTGPPGCPPPQVGFPVQYIEIDRERFEAIPACRRYYDILVRAVLDFVQSHPHHAREYQEAERDYYPVNNAS